MTRSAALRASTTAGSSTSTRTVQIGLDDLLVRAISPASPSGTRASGPTARMAASISRVGRRHDLRAVATGAAEPATQVDLVAVVLRRVVAGGHHHAGAARPARRTAWASTGVGSGRGQQQRPPPGAGGHPGGLLGEASASRAGRRTR